MQSNAVGGGVALSASYTGGWSTLISCFGRLYRHITLNQTLFICFLANGKCHITVTSLLCWRENSAKNDHFSPISQKKLRMTQLGCFLTVISFFISLRLEESRLRASRSTSKGRPFSCIFGSVLGSCRQNPSLLLRLDLHFLLHDQADCKTRLCRSD